MRALSVYCSGRFAGVLKELPGEGYTFEYDKSYMSDRTASSISLTMPKSAGSFSSRTLFPFFSNMLSEGHNREVQSKILHIDKNDDFGILAATATVDTPGAITVKSFDYD